MALRNLLETKYDLVSALTELAELAQKAGTSSIRERILSDRLPRLEEERAVLVVLGEFNHGKTTFVNALLGGRVLPTGVTPTTAIIHEVRYGERPAATVIRRPKELHLDERSRPIGGPRESVAFEKLEDLTAEGGISADDVLRVEIDYPAELLRDRVTLVDTPGVNDLNQQIGRASCRERV